MAIYLQLDGYTGNVTSGKYKGQIEIQSYSWGFTNHAGTTVGSASNRQSAGKVQPGDLYITKQQDQSSPQFMIDAMGGKMINSALLTVTRMDGKGGGEVPYMEYKLSNLLCTSFNTATSGDTGSSTAQPMENLSLNFTKIEIGQMSTAAGANGTIPPKRHAFDFEQVNQGGVA